MESNLNPYAPPAIADERDEEDVPILRARFFVTDVWRRKTAYDFLMPGALLLTSSMLVLFAGMGLGAIVGPWVFPGGPMPGPPPIIFGTMMFGFPIGAIGAVIFHIFAHQWLKRQNLRRLERHPTLRANGEWLLEIDHEQLRIATEGGQSSWPLEDVWWHFTHGELALLQLPEKLAVGIPHDAELTPPKPARFVKLVRSRVKRITLGNLI